MVAIILLYSIPHNGVQSANRWKWKWKWEMVIDIGSSTRLISKLVGEDERFHHHNYIREKAMQNSKTMTQKKIDSIKAYLNNVVWSIGTWNALTG